MYYLYNLDVLQTMRNVFYGLIVDLLNRIMKYQLLTSANGVYQHDIDFKQYGIWYFGTV